jgi:hypothetical protein
VSLHGGQVVSWRNDRGEELLFTSSKVCSFLLLLLSPDSSSVHLFCSEHLQCKHFLNIYTRGKNTVFN